MKNREYLNEQRKGLRTWIEIDSGALKKNYGTFRKIKGKKCALMAVIKSNAYGHGLTDIATLASHLNIDWIGVDSITEALALRESGIRKPILVLGFTLPERLADALHNSISLTISSIQGIELLRTVGPAYAKLRIHLKIDTGMHRQGFLPEELPNALMHLGSMPHVEIEGVYTHFAAAKDPQNKNETLLQIERFEQALALLLTRGIRPIRHAAATGGTLLFPQAHYDLVRVGIGMYGLWPAAEVRSACSPKITLYPVLSFRTVVGEVKLVKHGECIGYDFTECLARDSILAVLPIGYWHGYPRSLSNTGRVLVRGKRAKILGRISMDMTVIDVTDIPNVRIGDIVTLIGKDGKDEITADDLATRSGRINYEIVTNLNPRIKRIVL